MTLKKTKFRDVLIIFKSTKRKKQKHGYIYRAMVRVKSIFILKFMTAL